jgi:hypothetical protein
VIAYASSGPARRIVVVVATIAALVFTMRYAIVACLAARSPSMVAGLAPDNPVALRIAYRTAVASGGVAPAQQRAFADRALAVLRREPLSATAFGIAGLAADTGRAPAHARRLMEAGESVSRRDLLMQLWLIEDRVAQGDVAGALRHYDRALSIYPDSEGLLFPTLTGAIEVAAVREALVGYVRNRRPWVRSFLDYATGNGNADATTRLLVAADGPAGPSAFTRTFESGLLRNAAAAQDFARARMLAARLSRGSPAGWSALQPTRASSLAELRPLTWTVSEDQAYQLGFEADGAAALDIEPEGQGIALYRMIFPTPGTYRLVQRTEAENADDLSARWDVTCLRDTPATVAAVPIATATSSRFDIPADCRAVRLTLVVGGADRTGRSTLRFGGLILRPDGDGTQS